MQEIAVTVRNPVAVRRRMVGMQEKEMVFHMPPEMAGRKCIVAAGGAVKDSEHDFGRRIEIINPDMLKMRLVTGTVARGAAIGRVRVQALNGIRGREIIVVVV